MIKEISFSLEVNDGWPPVAVEGVFCEILDDNRCMVVSPPLFLKGLACGDVIKLGQHQRDVVLDFTTLRKSKNSTAWVMRQSNKNLPVSAIDALGCKVVSFPTTGNWSIDVPSSLEISQVDSVLLQLDEKEFAVAFPAFRH